MAADRTRDPEAVVVALVAGTAAFFAAVGVTAAAVIAAFHLYGPGTDSLMLVVLAWILSAVMWLPVGALTGLLAWLPLGALIFARHTYLEAQSR